jgi:hypothetical protein
MIERTYSCFLIPIVRNVQTNSQNETDDYLTNGFHEKVPSLAGVKLGSISRHSESCVPQWTTIPIAWPRPRLVWASDGC